jgi:UDP-GlcNAc:undecaprenyl-phosphate GlcNAc-1-phosphate transferase
MGALGTAALGWLAEGFIYLAIGGIIRDRVKSFLAYHRLVRPNFLGHELPMGMGIALLLFLLIHILFLLLLSHTIGVTVDIEKAFDFLWSGTLVLFVGWLDDTLGDASHKGLKGHFRALFRQGVLTTGALKAIGILIVTALLALRWREGIMDVILMIFFVTLSANTINLLDLRPGRAWKGSVLLIAVSVLLLPTPLPYEWLIPWLAGLGFLFPDDVKGQSMLGDAGSNLLGFWVGAWAAMTAPPLFMAGGIIVLSLIHAYSEKRSISQWIERHRFVRALDLWGRDS